MKKETHAHNESMFKGAPSSTFQTAELLRKRMTPAELLLWSKLKGKKMNGLKFRRQHPIQYYIVDFYCHSKKLIIELDGGYHSNKNQQQLDKERTEILESFDLKVIRFTNDQVFDNIDSVLQKIQTFIQSTDSKS